jgi:hypothetical protein
VFCIESLVKSFGIAIYSRSFSVGLAGRRKFTTDIRRHRKQLEGKTSLIPRCNAGRYSAQRGSIPVPKHAYNMRPYDVLFQLLRRSLRGLRAHCKDATRSPSLRSALFPACCLTFFPLLFHIFRSTFPVPFTLRQLALLYLPLLRPPAPSSLLSPPISPSSFLPPP